MIWSLNAIQCKMAAQKRLLMCSNTSLCLTEAFLLQESCVLSSGNTLFGSGEGAAWVELAGGKTHGIHSPDVNSPGNYLLYSLTESDMRFSHTALRDNVEKGSGLQCQMWKTALLLSSCSSPILLVVCTKFPLVLSVPLQLHSSLTMSTEIRRGKFALKLAGNLKDMHSVCPTQTDEPSL